MVVAVIEPPIAPVVTWEEAKAHLRIDSDEEQLEVEAMVATVTRWLDGPNGRLGISLMRQTLELRLDAFPAGSIQLPYGPVSEVESITYDDARGTAQEMDPAAYRLLGAEVRWRVAPAYGGSWPSPRADDEAVRIRYVAGWADADEVPAKSAILMMVGHLYANREAVNSGEMPLSFEPIIANERVFL